MCQPFMAFPHLSLVHEKMSCGVVPGSKTGVFRLTGGGGGGRRSVSVRPVAGRWPSISTSSSSSRSSAAAAAAAKGSFYEVLGISESGSNDEIKRAYKKMAKRYHPDACSADLAGECTRRFIEVQEAYETLSDPSSRALYDRDLACGLHLAFTAGRRRRGKASFVEDELTVRSAWKNQWQDQIAELKRRSTDDCPEQDLSWGARMRRQMAESSHD